MMTAISSWPINEAGMWSVRCFYDWHIIITICYYITANITVAPLSKSGPLYTLVNFTCEGIGDVLGWSVEGNSLSYPSIQDREISVTTNNISVYVWSSVLTIRALPINDGISVGCGLTSISPLGHVSKGATLTVKGSF